MEVLTLGTILSHTSKLHGFLFSFFFSVVVVPTGWGPLEQTPSTSQVLQKRGSISPIHTRIHINVVATLLYGGTAKASNSRLYEARVPLIVGVDHPFYWQKSSISEAYKGMAMKRTDLVLCHTLPFPLNILCTTFFLKKKKKQFLLIFVKTSIIIIEKLFMGEGNRDGI